MDGDKDFKYYLSSLRVHVEQAFGMLVDKLRILNNALNFIVKCNERIIYLCMKLHKFCIENKDTELSDVI